jgi:hypothetical protein
MRVACIPKLKVEKREQNTGEASDNVQSNFDQITSIVTSFFQVEESLLDRGIPTYYLKQPQETKTAFIALLKKLEETNFMAVLRRVG